MTAPELIRDLDDAFSRGGLARLMGVTEKTIWSWANGLKAPRPAKLAALQRLHGLLPEIRAAARGHDHADRLIA